MNLARAGLARIAQALWTLYYVTTALRLALGVRRGRRRWALRALRSMA